MVSLPWKDWGSAIVTAGLALVGVALTLFIKGRESKSDRVFKKDEEDRKAEHQLDIAQTVDLTARFKALMEGYEGRIKDLNGDIVSMRGELRQLKQQLESHQGICRTCPHFEERLSHGRSATSSTTP